MSASGAVFREISHVLRAWKLEADCDCGRYGWISQLHAVRVETRGLPAEPAEDVLQQVDVVRISRCRGRQYSSSQISHDCAERQTIARVETWIGRVAAL